MTQGIIADRAALRRFGLSERVIDLAAGGFVRPGAEAFDFAFADAVWDARARVSLARLALERPRAHVWVCEGGEPVMGFVPL